MIFHDRKHAGQLLTKKLQKYKTENPIILALPRGGVPIAAEIASGFAIELNVLIVRKVGAPFQSELAVGAICEEDEPIWNDQILSQVGLAPDDLGKTVSAERDKVKNQIRLFRKTKKFPSVAGRTVLIVDDGLATGATMTAAINYLKKKSTAKIVIAVPVAAASTAAKLRKKVNEVIVIEEREDLRSVGEWYEDFSQVTDDEVVMLLQEKIDKPKFSEREFEIPSEEFSKQTAEWFHVPPLYDKKIVHNTSNSKLENAIMNSMVTLHTEDDLDLLVQSIKDKRVVMLGEATHGTTEFYQIRSQISKRLIKDHGFKFIAVEGDWPDSYRLNKYIQTGEGFSAENVLMHNHRWPTWMWANDEVAKLAEWLRVNKAGFYGLDVYSLFESMNEVVNYLKKNKSHLFQEVSHRYSCFDSFEGNEIYYARSLLRDPLGCENEVLVNLQKLLEMRVERLAQDGNELFSAQQNARIVANAEAYYRAILSGEVSSWNVRDGHMIETFDSLLQRTGEDTKAIIWAHNTHIGDYRATNMQAAGYVNIGGLARQIYGDNNVALVGFGTYEGEVLAGRAWGAPEQVMPLPPAKTESYEYAFHQASLQKNVGQFFLLLEDKKQTPSAQSLGHRAIGVVYDSSHEWRGNYVPTKLSKRYDAFVFIDKTSALKSLHTTFTRGEFPETWPTGQ